MGLNFSAVDARWCRYISNFLGDFFSHYDDQQHKESEKTSLNAFCIADRASYCIISVKHTWCTFYLIYQELRPSICFKHYLLILRRSFKTAFGGTSSTAILVQPTNLTRTQFNKCRLCSASWGGTSNARNIQWPLTLNKLSRKCFTLVSLYWLIECI
jgi:hypothetical protein